MAAPLRPIRSPLAAPPLLARMLLETAALGLARDAPALRAALAATLLAHQTAGAPAGPPAAEDASGLGRVPGAGRAAGAAGEKAEGAEGLGGALLRERCVEEAIALLVAGGLARDLRGPAADGAGGLEATALGGAVVAAGFSPEQGLQVHRQLQRAGMGLVLHDETHLLFLLAPVYLPLPRAYPRMLKLLDAAPPMLARVATAAGVDMALLRALAKDYAAAQTNDPDKASRPLARPPCARRTPAPCVRGAEAQSGGAGGASGPAVGGAHAARAGARGASGCRRGGVRSHARRPSVPPGPLPSLTSGLILPAAGARG